MTAIDRRWVHRRRQQLRQRCAHGRRRLREGGLTRGGRGAPCAAHARCQIRWDHGVAWDLQVDQGSAHLRSPFRAEAVSTWQGMCSTAGKGARGVDAGGWQATTLSDSTISPLGSTSHTEKPASAAGKRTLTMSPLTACSARTVAEKRLDISTLACSMRVDEMAHSSQHFFRLRTHTYRTPEGALQQ
jgi:hypothetical protein